jgi:hypothetical protein
LANETGRDLDKFPILVLMKEDKNRTDAAPTRTATDSWKSKRANNLTTPNQHGLKPRWWLCC